VRSVVITGTSTGIGWGTAKVLVANGFRVFGSVRRVADAERLAAEFGPSFAPLPIAHESGAHGAFRRTLSQIVSALTIGFMANSFSSNSG